MPADYRLWFDDSQPERQSRQSGESWLEASAGVWRRASGPRSSVASRGSQAPRRHGTGTGSQSSVSDRHSRVGGQLESSQIHQNCDRHRSLRHAKMRRALDRLRAPFRPDGDCDGRLRREHFPSPRGPTQNQRPAFLLAEAAGLKTNPSKYGSLDTSLHVRR